MSSEAPIIFSGPMVLAILAGAKTQTRRLTVPCRPCGGRGTVRTGITRPPTKCQRCDGTGVRSFGKVGDVLWVREAWNVTFAFGANGATRNADWQGTPKAERAQAGATDLRYRASSPTATRRWATPLFMPRWASRLTLRITAIRREALHDITEQDALAEGAPLAFDLNAPATLASHRLGFEKLWGEIHGVASWRTNPQVWVVSFEVVPTP